MSRPSDYEMLFLLLSEEKRSKNNDRQFHNWKSVDPLEDFKPGYIKEGAANRSRQAGEPSHDRILCFEIFVLIKLYFFSWPWWRNFLLPHLLAHLKNAQGTETNREGDSIACSRGSDSAVRRKGKKKRKKNKEEKRERERGGNDCKICFQKVIPPTLSVRILNVVFIVKSCQSSNGRQSALLTEF